MKIILTCTSIQDEHRSEEDADSHYPLGLGYLQSYMEYHRPNQDEFINLYLNNEDYDSCYSILKKNLKEFRPDVFGVSMMTHSRVSAFRMIEYAHEHYPDTKIVVGGMHATVMWEQIVEKYPYITLVRGEGEVTLYNLIEAWDKNESINNIPGIAYHDGEKVVTTGSAPLISNIDDLPFPKHELYVHQGKKMANILTSRGCPYKCNFCVLDWMSRRKVRFRSGENIADEVEMLLNKFPSINTIWIHDDAFMINKSRTIEFCDAIIARGIKTQFVASARFRPISEEVVYKMEAAGFVHVLFGLESGADDVIAGMRKGITKEHVRYGMELFGKTNMKATAFLIAGLPGETDETIQETIDFVQEIQNINYLFYDDMGVAMTYPGTEMYAMAKKTGKISDDYWLTDADVPYYTEDLGGVHTYEKLMEMKATVRQAVSLQNMFTPEGFLIQRKLISPILKYSLQHGMTGINRIMLQSLVDNNLLDQVCHSLYFGASEQLLNQVSTSAEKAIIKIIMSEHLKTTEQKKDFFSKYKFQKENDDKLLLSYEKRREEVIDKLSDEDDAGDVEYVRPANKGNKSKKLDFDVSTNGGV